MARPTKTKYAILGALSIRPMSGYDIKKWVSDVTGGFWAESSGQVYPTLAKLLAARLIKCDESQGAGNRPRKVYTLTKKGKTELTKWIEQPAEKLMERNELLLKLFYGKNVLKKICIDHLKQHKASMEKEIIRCKSIEQHIKDQHGKNEDLFYWLITLKRAFFQLEAELAWCNEAEKMLNQIKK